MPRSLGAAWRHFDRVRLERGSRAARRRCLLFFESRRSARSVSRSDNRRIRLARARARLFRSLATRQDARLPAGSRAVPPKRPMPCRYAIHRPRRRRSVRGFVGTCRSGTRTLHDGSGLPGFAGACSDDRPRRVRGLGRFGRRQRSALRPPTAAGAAGTGLSAARAAAGRGGVVARSLPLGGGDCSVTAAYPL